MFKDNFISVNHFGAKGDGKTDDSPAIQAALYEAYLTNKDVYIPSGEYLLSSANFGNKSDGGKTAAALHVFSHTRLVGSGNSVLMADKGITHMIMCDNGENDADNNRSSGYNGAHGITIEHLTFDGGCLRGNNKCTPVNFSHSDNILINDVEVKNVIGGWHCIEINSSSNVEICGCRLGEGCDLSELIQLDAATNEGNLGQNDMTADRYVNIHDNYFFCNFCRAVGNHGNIHPYEGVQNWAEHISFCGNTVVGCPDNVSENVNPRHRPGYLNFVYHTRHLSVFENRFSVTVPAEDHVPYYPVHVGRESPDAPSKLDDKTVRIYNNIFDGFAGENEDDFFTAFDNLVL